MAYIDGFVAAVPAANKDAFVKHATEAAKIFKRLGATRVVETWGDDVQKGKVTDFQRAVQAKSDEVVVFSWIEYPDKPTRDRASKEMMNDPEMKKMTMPFDGMRMIFAGFQPVLDV